MKSLLSILKAPDTQKLDRIEAMEKLKEVCTPDSILELLPFLIDVDDDLRKKTVEVLDKLDNKWRTPSLLSTLISELILRLKPLVETIPLSEMINYHVDLIGLFGDSGCGDKEVLQILVETLKNPNQKVQSAAIKALDKIDPEWPKLPQTVKLVDDLRKMITSENYVVRPSGIKALKKIDFNRYKSELEKAESEFLEKNRELAKKLDHGPKTNEIINILKELQSYESYAKSVIPDIVKLLSSKKKKIIFQV